MSAQDSHGGAVQEGDLRVWWIPQMPMEAFYVPVESLAQAKWLLSVLADYDAFQFENCIKPDYCNAGGLQVREDGSWLDWMDPETGDDIDSWDPAARPIDTAELERLDDIMRDPLSGLTWDNRIMAADAICEVLAHRKAEAGMRALLRAGCDLLAIESEALRNGIRIVGDPDRLSDAPEDAHAVEAIREIEDWIASVKATLYPTTPEAEGGCDERA